MRIEKKEREGNEKLLLSVKETCELTGLSEKTERKICYYGRYKCCRKF